LCAVVDAARGWSAVYLQGRGEDRDAREGAVSVYLAWISEITIVTNSIAKPMLNVTTAMAIRAIASMCHPLDVGSAYPPTNRS
jgi:hypothetical protein